MAFQIIIDGYNFIGKQRGLLGDIERKREELIRTLSQYRKTRGFSITVVFDGWGSGWDTQHGDIREGVRVVFSQQGEKADDVICRMAGELGERCLVVSSDREIQRSVHAAGGVTIEVEEFAEKLSGALRLTQSMREEPEDQPAGTRIRKKGNPNRLSKKERKKRQRMNKL